MAVGVADCARGRGLGTDSFPNSAQDARLASSASVSPSTVAL